MEVLVDIEECLLGDFDRAARIQNITRNAAIRGAITDWLSQARRDAVVRELFDAEFESSGTDRSDSEKPFTSSIQAR
jgi:hypothetical protein